MQGSGAYAPESPAPRFINHQDAAHFDKMRFCKFVLSFFRSLFAKAKPPAEMDWPEEPLDLPRDHHGGFYDASLGVTLNSRYVVVRKLGWGQHSNVWLVRDVK